MSQPEWTDVTEQESGRWLLTSRDERGRIRYAAVLHGDFVGGFTPEGEVAAMAHLMCGAPDLLEAAEAVVKEHAEFMARIQGFNFDTDWCRLLGSLGAAVRKSRGAS